MAIQTLGESGELHVVAGKITGGDTLTCTDGSATLTDTGTGNWTVNFGAAFLAAPYVTTSVFQATFSTLATKTVNLVSVATDSIVINAVINTTSGTVTALDDNEVHFIAVGKRNR